MAALTFLQQNASANSATLTNTAGNLLVVWVTWESTNAAPTVSDTAGNIYQQAVGWSGAVVAASTTGPTRQAYFYCLSCVAKVGNVITPSGPDTGAYIVIANEYTVPAGVSMVLNPLAVTANNNQLPTGSSPFTVPFTLNPILASASELVIITMTAQAATPTYASFPATFVQRFHSSHIQMEDNSAQTTSKGSTLTLAMTSTTTDVTCTATIGFCAGYSISGTASAGAKVTAFSTTRLAYAGSATADGSGNYTITGVPDSDTYLITPYAGCVYSPLTHSVTLAGANVTGVNFTNITTLVYTQLAVDTGQRANENPINPALWDLITATGEPPLEIASNEIQGSSTASHSGQNVSILKTVIPNDQYFQVQLDNISSAGNPANLLAVLRSTSPATTPSLIAGVAYRVFGPFGNGCGVGIFKQTAPGQIVTNYLGAGGGNAGRDNPCIIWPVNPHSIVRGEAYGTTFTFLIDGFPVCVIADTGDSLLSESIIHLDAYRIQALTDVQMSFFSAGSIALPAAPSHYSVPDDRNYGNFPNSSRTVNGTKIYDVPSKYSLQYWFDTLFNRTQPLPVDSRAAVPADSRVSPNIPQNSRAPGTYGPGE